MMIITCLMWCSVFFQPFPNISRYLTYKSLRVTIGGIFWWITRMLLQIRTSINGISTKSGVSELWPAAHVNWRPSPFKATSWLRFMYGQILQCMPVLRFHAVFVAGSDRVPVGGLQNLGLTIAELQIPRDDAVDDHDEESSEDRLSRFCPVAHCCDNNEYNRTLDLPMYTSKELVKDRLMATLSFSNCPFHIA